MHVAFIVYVYRELGTHTICRLGEAAQKERQQMWASVAPAREYFSLIYFTQLLIWFNATNFRLHIPNETIYFVAVSIIEYVLATISIH